MLLKLKSLGKNITSSKWTENSEFWKEVTFTYDGQFSYVSIEDFVERFPSYFICVPHKNKLRSLSLS